GYAGDAVLVLGGVAQAPLLQHAGDVRLGEGNPVGAGDDRARGQRDVDLDRDLGAARVGVDDVPDPAACGHVDAAAGIGVEERGRAVGAEDQVGDLLGLDAVAHDRGGTALDLLPQRQEQVLLDLGGGAAGQGQSRAVEAVPHGRVHGAEAGLGPLAIAVVVAGKGGEEPVIVVGVRGPVVGRPVVGRAGVAGLAGC